MEEFQQHYLDLMSRIEEVVFSEGTRYQKAIRKYHICQQYNLELRPLVIGHLKAHPEDEIFLYKEIRPKIHAELLYWQYRSKWEFELSSLKGKALKRWAQHKASKLNSFLQRNRKLYSYYLLDRSEKDKKYFCLRSESSAKSYFHPDLDTESYNPNSICYAKFIATQRLLNYLAPFINSTNTAAPIETDQAAPTIAWTGTKAQFIEWVYALQSSGSIQHGNVEVKTLFDVLGKTFGIDVTHYYGYFQRMRIRKKDRTPYLNLVTEFLIRRMDECDEFPRAPSR